MAVPAEIRKKYSLRSGSKLYWLDTGKEIKVIPIPVDPVKEMYGSASGKKILSKLLEEREKDKDRGRP